MILALLLACRGGRIDPTDEQHAGPQWTSIEGTLDIDYTVDSFVVCDATVSFTGVPYTGECEDCEFAFEIDAVLERDDGAITCPWNPWLFLYASGSFWTDPTVLGFEDHNNGVPDVLVMGASGLYPDGQTYTYFVEVDAVDGLSTSLVGDEFTWALNSDSASYTKPFFGTRYSIVNPCTYPYFAYGEQGPFGVGNTIYGSLLCEYGWVDAFEFEGAEGGVAYLTADTTGDPSVAMFLWVYGPESCVEGAAFASFECSTGSLPCPAMSIDTGPGRYVAVVSGVGCEGDGFAADYRLDLATEWDPRLEQIQDDVSNFAPASLHMAGAAILTQ